MVGTLVKWYNHDTDVKQFICPHCMNRKYNNQCQICNVSLSDIPFTAPGLCIECTYSLDINQIKENAILEINEKNIHKLDPNDMYTPRPCDICDKKTQPNIDLLYCEEHSILFSLLNKYHSFLYKQGKCLYCEKELSEKEIEFKERLCRKCWKIDVNSRNCRVCNTSKGKKWDNYCINCINERANKIETLNISGSVGEQLLFTIVKKVFQDELIIRNYRPKWLEGLEIDIYLPNRKMGFEYDGEQHFKYIPYFHTDYEHFDKQKKRDKLKDEICKKGNIHLIRFSYLDRITESLINKKLTLIQNDIN